MNPILRLFACFKLLQSLKHLQSNCFTPKWTGDAHTESSPKCDSLGKPKEYNLRCWILGISKIS